MDEYNGNQLRYPLNRFLSGGQRYPVFEQSGAEVKISPQKAAHLEPHWLTPPPTPSPTSFRGLDITQKYKDSMTWLKNGSKLNCKEIC